MVEELCACADQACSDAASAKLDQGDPAYDGAVFSHREEQQLMQMMMRMGECQSRFQGGGADGQNPAVAAANRMADAVCACADLDCAMQAAQVGAKELEQHKNTTGTRADADAIIAAGQRAADCVKALAEKDKAAEPKK